MLENNLNDRQNNLDNVLGIRNKFLNKVIKYKIKPY